jgi:hypothetical protein
MPVRKFRSVEEMNTPIWRRPGDPALVRAIASVWAFGRRSSVRAFSPGVRKFRSVTEMKTAVTGALKPADVVPPR